MKLLAVSIFFSTMLAVAFGLLSLVVWWISV